MTASNLWPAAASLIAKAIAVIHLICTDSTLRITDPLRRSISSLLTSRSTSMVICSPSFKFSSYAIAALSWSFRQAGCACLSRFNVQPQNLALGPFTHALAPFVVSSSRNKFSVRTPRVRFNPSWSSNVPFLNVHVLPPQSFPHRRTNRICVWNLAGSSKGQARL